MNFERPERVIIKPEKNPDLSEIQPPKKVIIKPEENVPRTLPKRPIIKPEANPEV